MKIIFTVTYEVERVTVKELLADHFGGKHRYQSFMEDDALTPCGFYQSTDYLQSLNPRKKLYGVISDHETTEVRK